MLRMIKNKDYNIMAKKEKKFFRKCSNCDKQKGYATARSRDAAEANGSVCRSCSNTLYKTGLPMTAERNAKISSTMKGVAKTDEHKASMSAYKDNLKETYTLIYGERTQFKKHYFSKWGKEVRERDNNTCQRCNAEKTTPHSIHAHHIAPSYYFSELGLNIDNGITLCSSCHRSIHGFIDRLTLSGIKLDAEGFQTHTSRFINGNKATNVPTEYKSVFSPSVTIVKE